MLFGNEIPRTPHPRKQMKETPIVENGKFLVTEGSAGVAPEMNFSNASQPSYV